MLLGPAEALQRDRARGAGAHGGGVLLEHLGVEMAGGHRGHAYARVAPARRELNREGLHSGPGRTGMGHTRHAVMGRERHVHDRARARRSERELEGRLGHVEHALHVQPPHRAPSLVGDQLRRREVLAAGVVHEHVEPPSPLEDRAHQTRCVGRLAHVTRDPLDPADLADLRGGLLEHIGAAPRDRDRGAAASELLRSRLSQPRSAAGHERDLAFEQPGREHQRCTVARAHRQRS